MSEWTVLIAAASLAVASVVGFFAVRVHRRSLRQLRLTYGFSRPEAVDLADDNEVWEVDVMLANPSREPIRAEEFSGKPIIVRFNAPVLEILRVTSRPTEQLRPRTPVIDGRRIRIEPFAFCRGQEVRIRVRTGELPHDMLVRLDAPALVVERRHRVDHHSRS
jgi:hypothetical protein